MSNLPQSHETSTAAPVLDAGLLAVLQLRYWQHLLNEMLKQKRFKIPIHLAFGHEAAAVAMDETMGPDDQLCLSHRNAAYNLARCKSLERVLAHYQLTVNTPPGGLMGSMNLAMPDTEVTYSSSILGNNVAVAAGIAMHRIIAKQPGVVFVCTGDGAIEEGAFWESMVFSRSHRLPLVIVVENNDHSMSSTIAQRRSPIELSHICAGLGYGYFRASGAILAEVRSVLDRARVSAANGAPACVELEIATFCQHAGPTPGWPDDPRRIDINDGLLVQDSPADPVYHVRQAFGDEEFARVSTEIMKAGARE